MKKKDMNSLLSKIEKPLRYIDHEINAFHKDFHSAKVKYCFIYPDVYEIGISHLGLKILYSIINKFPDSMADRAYTPWTDLGDKLLKEHIPLSAIESKKNLIEFDCLGFTLATELTYTNILYTLELSQIPLRCQDRNDEHPIIIAGGINAINPHPLSLFIDAFLIGEAEEGILRINDIFLKEKNRDKRLTLLSELDFMYVSNVDGIGKDKTKTSNKKTVLKYTTFSNSLNTHYPQIVPLLEGTHNRYTAEIMRGCTRGCRFCQAGMFYRPVREKCPEIIMEQLLTDTKNSGWSSCGLMSLSSSDYSQIKPLINKLVSLLKGTGISISMPSLRMNNIDINISEMMNHLKKSGITLAPEAGTQRLRNIINKNLTEEEILEAVRFAFDAGAKLIKLYFMIGLPFETDDDIEGIISLVIKIIEQTKRKMRLNISISPFVPKPFTPFQWAKIDSENIVLGKALKIKHALIKYKFIKINYHTVELSFLETILCRGNKETGYVIEQAYLKGAKFDSWREHFNYSIWKQAADIVGYDWNKCINGFSMDEALPWDNIDIGVSKKFLINEYKKAEKGQITHDCRESECNRCNMDAENINTVLTCSMQNGIKLSEMKMETTHQIFESYSASDTSLQKCLYRIYFSKLNDLKYLSHLDFLRLIHRLLMLSGLPISFSEGFNPHPRTSFCPPLSSGVEGVNDFFDIWMSDNINEKEILNKLSKTKINDLCFHKAELLFENNKHKSNYIPISDFDIESIEVVFLNFNQIELEEINKKFNLFKSSNDTLIERERKGVKKQVDLKHIIQKIVLNESKLFVEKKIQGASIFDILKKIFGIERDDIEKIKLLRIDLKNQKH